MAKTKLEKGIFEQLPQIPYVIDQIGEALAWAKEELSEGDYNKIVRIAYDVAVFTKEISDPNFFKTHLVLASILSNIEDVITKERFEKFDTASKATESAIKDLAVPSKNIESQGCFKSTLVHLATLAKKDENLFAVALVGVKHDLEEVIAGMKKVNVKKPITPRDYITILGYAFIMANLRMAHINLLDRTWKIYNEIEVILNSINY